MSSSNAWKTILAGALTGATLLLSASALLALGAQAGPLMWPRAIGFAYPHDRRAFHILEAKAPSSAELEQAVAETGRAVALSPYDNAARLRMAYAGALLQGALKGESLKRLAESYDLIPYDHTVAAWRIAYSLEHWDSLTPDVRTAVQAEAMAFGRGLSSDVDVRRVLKSIKNPEGRLAASLWLRALAN